MARKIRIEYAGAAYHVTARGNQGRAIYADERDRKLWLETLGEACAKTGWRIHTWVMMDNHYHLLLETPEANLVAGMKWLQGTYTQRYNSRHEIFGHLFQGRYKAVVVVRHLCLTLRSGGGLRPGRLPPQGHPKPARTRDRLRDPRLRRHRGTVR